MPVLTGESTEFKAFLRGPTVRGLSSHDLGWKGFVIEEHYAAPGERPEAVFDQHILVLLNGHPGTSEHANGRGWYVSYPKLPGMITVIPPGIVPANHSTEPVRTRNVHSGTDLPEKCGR
jgi:hypothetical protein